MWHFKVKRESNRLKGILKLPRVHTLECWGHPTRSKPIEINVGDKNGERLLKYYVIEVSRCTLTVEGQILLNEMAVLYGSICWAFRKERSRKMEVAE